MSWMFWSAVAFNQDIGGWTVAQVEDMSFMFYQAIDFDHSLGDWDISAVTVMTEMLFLVGLSSENYSSTLIGWAALPNVPSNITLGALGQTYCPGTAVADARQQLLDKGDRKSTRLNSSH